MNQISYVSQDGLDSQVTLAIDPALNNWWPNPVSLSLQREDGSYIGADKEGNLFAIGADGSVQWQQQIASPLTPLYATADGGAIVTTTTAPCQPAWVVAPFGTPACPLGSQSQSQLGTLYTVDQNGNVTSQMPDTGAIPSWGAQWYAPSGATIANVALSSIEWASSYQSIGGGNLSSNAASVGVAESVEGLPVFALSFWGPSCKLPPNPADRQKVHLAGDALTQYGNLRQALLSGNYLTCPACSAFFDGAPTRASYFSQLTTAVTNQAPYDGLQTNISQYEAGMLSAADLNDPQKVKIFQGAPVCGWFVSYQGSKGFVSVRGRTTAASQIHAVGGGPATDVYINTKDLKDLSQGTILHEALHNLTGLYDDLPKGNNLEELLGLKPKEDCSNGTICITNKLVGAGCAGPH